MALLKPEVVALLMAFTFASCGSEKSRNYDNPADTSEKNSSTCLLGLCNPPANTVFDFADSIDLTISGCTASGQVEVFDSGTDIVIFSMQNCGLRNDLYFEKRSYAGSIVTAPILLTPDCQTMSGIGGFGSDKGTSGYLLSYSCKVGTSSYAQKVAAVDSTGIKGTPYNFGSTTTIDASEVIWNSTAGTFGVFRIGYFQRFNQSAAPIGGPIVMTDDTITSAFEIGGSWFFLSSNGNNGNGYCSKVSSSGVLNCNRINLPYSPHYFRLSNRIDGRIIGYRYDDFQSYSLNLSDCSATMVSSNSLSPVNKFKSRNGRLNSEINLGASLDFDTYLTSNSLIFTTFNAVGASIYAESSVTGYTTWLSGGVVKRINNRIYIPYAKDGRAYVSYSTQTIP